MKCNYEVINICLWKTKISYNEIETPLKDHIITLSIRYILPNSKL